MTSFEGSNPVLSNLVRRAGAKGAMRLGKGGGSGGTGGDDGGGAVLNTVKPKAPPRKRIIPSGTSLYHGTRYQPGGLRWWEDAVSPYPNVVGEDGGVSFTLDPESSPKTRNANVLLKYELEWDMEVYYCESKSDFYQIFQQDPDAVCYADFEQEVSFHQNKISAWLAVGPEVVREP